VNLLERSVVAGEASSAAIWSPEPRREVGDETDGRDPPVSDRVREGTACARCRRRVGRPGPWLSGPAATAQCVFLFLFILKVIYV